MAIVNLASAVALLREGDLVAFPTETVYGLAARIDDEIALAKIFSTKRRPFFDPLIVHVPSVLAARDLSTGWTQVHADLATRFWPGPLTLVVPKGASVSSLITSGHDTVGLRCPRHPVALELLVRLGVPLAAPSANMFGRTSPTTAQHVEDEFEGRVAVLDGGACEVGVESTVVTISGKELLVLRPGGVSMTDLARALVDAGHDLSVAFAHSNQSPGHTEAHYRPRNPVVLVTREMTEDELRARTRALSGDDEFTWMTLPTTPELAARVLYSEMRRLSERPTVLLVRRPESAPGNGWEAILDRLQRAAVQVWT